MNGFDYIKNNYIALCEELKSISASLARPTPTLVCVTKSGTDEELIALAKAGATDIGENRPQELKRRRELLLENGLTPRFHQIGTLQRNKVKTVIDGAALIHSVDSLKLAADIDRLAEARGIVMPILIEINSAREENKSGVFPEEAENILTEIMKLKGVSVVGLMTMGPVCEDAEDIRPYFRLTKKLFDELCEKYGFGDTPILSMGMSDSYRIAIEEGSTLVRVGRRLFIK